MSLPSIIASHRAVPTGLNQGSCTSRMSSLSFVASNTCIAAFRRRILTLPMENLDIVMCLRRVSQGLVKVPPVVCDRCVKSGSGASPTQGRGTVQGRCDVWTGVVCGDTTGTERTHPFLTGAFPAGVVGGGFLRPHTVQSGIVEDRRLTAGDGGLLPGGRLVHLSIRGKVTQISHFLLIEDLSEGDRAAEGLQVDVPIPGGRTANACRAGTLLARADTPRTDPRVTGQGGVSGWPRLDHRRWGRAGGAGKDGRRGRATRWGNGGGDGVLDDCQSRGGKVATHGASSGTCVMTGLLAQEALIRAVADTRFDVRLSSAYGVMVNGGVVAPTANASDRGAGDLARLGILVVAKFVASAALDEVGLIATVDVLHPGAIHADSLARGPCRQCVTVIDESEDNGARAATDALRADLEVGGNRHEGAREHGVGAQFRGQVLPDHAMLSHRGDAPKLCPGETPNGAQLDELAKQGADNVSVGEDQSGRKFASKCQHKVTVSDRPASTEDLRWFGDRSGEASLEVPDQVRWGTFLNGQLHLIIVNAAKPDDRHVRGVRGNWAGLVGAARVPCWGAALDRLCVSREGLGRLLVKHGGLGKVLGLPDCPRKRNLGPVAPGADGRPLALLDQGGEGRFIVDARGRSWWGRGFCLGFRCHRRRGRGRGRGPRGRRGGARSRRGGKTHSLRTSGGRGWGNGGGGLRGWAGQAREGSGHLGLHGCTAPIHLCGEDLPSGRCRLVLGGVRDVEAGRARARWGWCGAIIGRVRMSESADRHDVIHHSVVRTVNRGCDPAGLRIHVGIRQVGGIQLGRWEGQNPHGDILLGHWWARGRFEFILDSLVRAGRRGVVGEFSVKKLEGWGSQLSHECLQINMITG
jgi:hypothetical protein